MSGKLGRADGQLSDDQRQKQPFIHFWRRQLRVQSRSIETLSNITKRGHLPVSDGRPTKLPHIKCADCVAHACAFNVDASEPPTFNPRCFTVGACHDERLLCECQIDGEIFPHTDDFVFRLPTFRVWLNAKGAEKLSVQLNIEFAVIPNCTHDFGASVEHGDMLPGAAHYLN